MPINKRTLAEQCSTRSPCYRYVAETFYNLVCNQQTMMSILWSLHPARVASCFGKGFGKCQIAGACSSSTQDRPNEEALQTRRAVYSVLTPYITHVGSPKAKALVAMEDIFLWLQGKPCNGTQAVLRDDPTNIEYSIST